MTNALATTQPKPPIMAGGSVAALVPQSLDEAFRVSQAIAASGLAPRGLDKPEQIMVAIMAGAELGLAPFQALQSFAVVNGRPTLWGDGLMAVARAQGIRAREWIEGEGDGASASCEVTRPDTGEVILRTFTVADAKKASLWGKAGPWQSYPKRMLQMRARAWALRDGCADMLRGFQVREEVEDFGVRDITPRAAPNIAARLAAPKDGPAEGFTAHHPLGDDDIPEFDAPADEAATVEDPFPGDVRPTEDDAAGPAEAHADDGTGPAADDLLIWANDLLTAVEGYDLDAFEALEGSELDLARFAQLKVENLPLAQKIEAAMVRRKKALG
jgi:hypothetical protein